MNLNTKVVPVNAHGEFLNTKSSLTYGYTKSAPFVDCGEERVIVYWPQIGKRGSWPVSLLKIA